MTDRKAMKMALEALQSSQESGSVGVKIDNAITALRQAIERPQTPEDLLRQSEREGWRYAKECEAEIKRLHKALEQPECNPHPDAPHGFNRDASHSLGRYVCDCEGWKPEEKEPVAWWNPRYGKGEYAFAEEQSPPDDPNDQSDFGWNIPLYAVPLKQQEYGCTECGKLASDGWALYCVECLVFQEKELVGLTDEEIAVGAKQSWVNKQAFESAVWWAEEKLREKNGF